MQKLGYPLFRVSLVLALIFLGCTSPVDPGSSHKSTGGIIGKAYFNNANTHEGIAITLEKTDGLQSASASYAQTSGRAIFNPAGLTAAVTTQDGSYAFTGVPVGTYTLYASSKNSQERAVAANVTVAANVQITAADLHLTPVGTLTGSIFIDNKPTGNMGFLVFIASTSYMAITGDGGNFTISDVPVGTRYQIVIMKGTYTGVWTSAASVSAGAVTSLGTKNISATELSSGGMVWKGSLSAAPGNPQTNWAYYNTTDKTSYIYDGSNWQTLAADGAIGPEGPKGDKGDTGISLIWKGASTTPPANPQTNWAYYNTTDKTSYIYDGSDWQILAADGLNALTGTVSLSTAGGPGVYKTVTANIDGLQGSGTPAYIWQRGDTSTGTFSPISGATDASYTLVTVDLGKYIKVQVSRNGYSGYIASDAIGPIEVLSLAELQKREMVNATTTEVTITGNAAYADDYADHFVGAFPAGRKVTLSPFAIGKYEITYELWYTVRQWATSTDRGVNRYTIASPGSEGHNGTDGAAPTEAAKYEPVTTISWRDAIVWCNAYSEMAGKAPVYYKADGTTILRVSTTTIGTNIDADQALIKGWPGSVPNGYRLPTEAEWEYAARGGGTPTLSTPFTYTYAGSNTAGDVAWIDEDYSSLGTHSVGGKAANALGLYDMSGNVFEWCWDRYESISTGIATNPTGPAIGGLRVARGGAWNHYAIYAAVAFRDGLEPYGWGTMVGFRVVCPLVP
jgi:formylglycine-generating enzyme required for sulfatase activity